MTIGRVLYILGIVMILYAVISGIRFHATLADGDWDYAHNYSLKLGTLIGGIILIVIGNKLNKK